MCNVKFSLLMPSIGPMEKVIDQINWFNSFDRQDLELVFVDQMGHVDGVNNDLFGAFPNVQHVISSKKGLSANRNIGLALCRGEFVVLLDDDARFLESNFGLIESIFAEYADASILSCGIVDLDGNLTSYTPGNRAGYISVGMASKRINSNGLVFRRCIAKNFLFDESMGVGSLYGSCEELDYVVRVMRSGGLVYYSPQIRVCHPPPPSSESREYNYGLGHGYFVRKRLNSSPILVGELYLVVRKLVVFMCKATVGILGALTSFERVKYYRKWSHGFLSGLFAVIK